MPTATLVFLSRRESSYVPWPKVYVITCIMVSAAATHRALTMTQHQSWKPRMDHDLPINFEIEDAKTKAIAKLVRDTMGPVLRNFQFSDNSAKVASFILEDTFSFWSFVSLMFCSSTLAGLALTKYALGAIYPTERRPIYKKLFNYGCNKFFLVFAINKCQYIDEALFWCYWFATLALVRAVIQLCKYKQLFYTTRSTDPGRPGMWLMMGLAGALLTLMTVTALVLSTPHKARLLWPVALTAGALGHRALCLHLRIPYSIEKRRPHHYRLTMLSDALRLFMETASASRWLLRSRMLGVPFAALDLYRVLLLRAVPRYRLHLQYVTLLEYVRLHDDAFPPASAAELQALADVCAVCQFAMETAAKLPCGHMYHEACLRRWLLRERTCPMCRASVRRPRARVTLDEEWPGERYHAYVPYTPASTLWSFL